MSHLSENAEDCDLTSTLLGGFSPFLHRVLFDSSANSLELQLLDDIERPSSVRVLRFERLGNVEITAHDSDDRAPNFVDGMIGARRRGNSFHFHTDRFSICFSCGAFNESIGAFCHE